jgi:hypothetical protein
MQQFFGLLSSRLFTAQHVSGVFPPIIRSSMTAVAASGFTFVSWLLLNKVYAKLIKNIKVYEKVTRHKLQHNLHARTHARVGILKNNLTRL